MNIPNTVRNIFNLVEYFSVHSSLPLNLRLKVNKLEIEDSTPCSAKQLWNQIPQRFPKKSLQSDECNTQSGNKTKTKLHLKDMDDDFLPL